MAKVDKCRVRSQCWYSMHKLFDLKKSYVRCEYNFAHLQKKFGARVIIEGAHIGESKEYAEKLVAEEGFSYVNGYDDPSIIAGGELKK